MKKFSLLISIIAGFTFIASYQYKLSAANPAQKIVVEQLTAPSCPYCPAGIAKFEELERKLKSTVIPINIHTAVSPMYASSYHNIISERFDATPQGSINRKLNRLYTSQYSKAIENLTSTSAIADISLSAHFTDETKNIITASIQSKFIYDYPGNANYKISIVITENDVTGTSSRYNQQNYFSGIMIMGGFELLPNPVPASQMSYDHVARELIDHIDQNLPSSISANVPYTLTHTFDIPENIINTNNIELTALLIDNHTGEIINADRIQASSIADAPSSSFILQHGNTSLTNNQEILIKDINPELGTMKVPLSVKNTGSTSVSIKVKRTEVSLVQGSINQFCWGDICLLPEVSESPEAITINPNEVSNAFYAEYIPTGKNEISTIKYDFYDQNNPSSTFSVILKFQDQSITANEMINQSSQVYLQNTELIVENHFSEKIQIYTIDGSLIYEGKKLSGQSKFDISNLPTGIWIVKGSSGWVRKISSYR